MSESKRNNEKKSAEETSRRRSPLFGPPYPLLPFCSHIGLIDVLPSKIRQGFFREKRTDTFAQHILLPNPDNYIFLPLPLRFILFRLPPAYPLTSNSSEFPSASYSHIFISSFRFILYVTFVIITSDILL